MSVDVRQAPRDRKFKCGSGKPLMLWCSSHTTLAAEEIPLLLQAGFRIIPLTTDIWTYQHRPELDADLCQDWKQTIEILPDVIAKLQAIRLFSDDPSFNFSASDLELLDRYVDVVYLTVLPNIAVKLTECFQGTVIFRPFGHGHLTTYTHIARTLGATHLEDLRTANNYIWCPILSTLQEPEDPSIWTNPVHVGPFVTPDRLGTARWDASTSQPIVVETIPRIGAQGYYREIYGRFVEDFGALPLQILGGNEANGGNLGDPRIVGRLSDEAYFARIASARISIYHGTSPYHLHYHPLEYMALGVPVLFHENSAIAAESRNVNLTEEELVALGMYNDGADAVRLARQALADPQWAASLSQRQRFFCEELFSRRRALYQAQWLRTLCIAQRDSMSQRHASHTPPATVAELASNPKPVRSWPVKIGRELARFSNQLRRTVGSADNFR